MSIGRYGSYRDSGVEWLGEVPSDWCVKRLRFVAELNPSKSEVSDLPDDTELSFLPMEAIGETGEVDLSRTRSLGEVRSGYSYFADGDVVLAKVTPCLENGKGALLAGLFGGRGFGTTELTVLRPRQRDDGPFLWWLTCASIFRGPAEGEMVGAGGLKRVPDEFVADFPAPWPPLAERSAIVAFLDGETAKIDALIKEQRRLIELLKEKRQAVISDAVTKGLDPAAPMMDSRVEWLGDIPAHWDVIALSRLIDPKRPITYGIVQPGSGDPNGRYMVRGQDYSSGWNQPDEIFRVSPEIEEPYRRARLRAGDLVMTIVGAGTGNVATVPAFLEGANITQTTARIAPDDGILGTFLSMSLASRVGQVQVQLFQKGAAQPGLNLEHLKAFRIPVPPRAEQVAIVGRITPEVSSLSALIGEASSAITLLQERRAALISAAVTGKIDVQSTSTQLAEAEAA